MPHSPSRPKMVAGEPKLRGGDGSAPRAKTRQRRFVADCEAIQRGWPVGPKGERVKQIHFNTKRLYTKHGQRITATLHDDQVVTFCDHDRMVTGEFKLCGDRFDPDVVMHAYDYNLAPQSLRSHHDAYYEDGCNREYKE